jgi:hypothetical protein
MVLDDPDAASVQFFSFFSTASSVCFSTIAAKDEQHHPRRGEDE